MNIFASEPVEASELNSFLDEIFSKFDKGGVARDEYAFSRAWREEDCFRETVEDIAIEIVEENESGNSTRREQNIFFRKALVEYFEYRVLFGVFRPKPAQCACYVVVFSICFIPTFLIFNNQRF